MARARRGCTGKGGVVMLTRSNRIALHMVDATTTELPRSGGRRMPAIWRAWMSLATLALLSTGLAVVIVWVLRRAL